MTRPLQPQQCELSVWLLTRDLGCVLSPAVPCNALQAYRYRNCYVMLCVTCDSVHFHFVLSFEKHVLVREWMHFVAGVAALALLSGLLQHCINLR